MPPRADGRGGRVPLRAALVGYGLSGRFFHRPLMAATPGLEVGHVVTADPVRRRQAAAELPDALLVGSIEELLADPGGCDLVVVAAGTAAHVELTLAALERGLPVVLDKPMAPTLAEGRRLVEAAGAAGVALVPFHNRRWDADHLTLRRLLADGALGEVLRYESRFERWRPAPDRRSWRETLPPARGGGVLLDLGTHLVDQALELFGPVARVYAEVSSRRGGADDDVFVALEHRSGARSHLWAGALAAAPGPRLRVLGRRAAFVVQDLDGQEAALRAGTPADAPGFGVEPPERWGLLEHGGEGAAEPVPSERGSWPAFYQGVVGLLTEGRPPPVAAGDALAALAVLEAARTAAAEGKLVEP